MKFLKFFLGFLICASIEIFYFLFGFFGCRFFKEKMGIIFFQHYIKEVFDDELV
jgi:hypothetical protein